MQNRVATNAKSIKRSHPRRLTCMISTKRRHPRPPNPNTILTKRSHLATNSMLASQLCRVETVTMTRAKPRKRTQTQDFTTTQAHVTPSKRSHDWEVWVRDFGFAGRSDRSQWDKNRKTKPKLREMSKDCRICRASGARRSSTRLINGPGPNSWSFEQRSGPQTGVPSPTGRTSINESGCSFLGGWRNSFGVASRKSRTAIQAETAPPRSSTLSAANPGHLSRSPLDRQAGTWYSIRKYIIREKLGLRAVGFESLFCGG